MGKKAKKQKDLKTLPYRPCAGIILLNQDNKVFMGKRIDGLTDYWQMPQGGIDKGEEAWRAALREMKEEIGTDKASLIKESDHWYRYDLPDELIGKVWKGRYRGQEQKWFALRFLGTDADINIATAHPEFCDYKWMAFHEITDHCVPFKRKLYEDLYAEFSPLISRSFS